MRLLDLPDALREFGLEPVLVDGWQGRGYDFDMPPRLHLRHWTAGPATGRAPSLGIVTNGRGGSNPLPGPLAQVLQERTGRSGLDRVYVVAAGRANHAGTGFWRTINSGNRHGTGNEIEWSGPNEAFGGNRIETSERVAAALQSLHPAPAGEWCCEHREYATPAGRKIDTNLNGHTFRVHVQSLLTNPTGDGGPELDATERAMLTDVRNWLAAACGFSDPVGSAPREGWDFERFDLTGEANPNEPPRPRWMRWILEDLERTRKMHAMLVKLTPDAFAQAVVEALPPSQGGAGLTETQMRTIVREVVLQELGHLKPGV